jgi:3alpha(or 20beta)-hydroxysteroid dehydrogenase
MDDFSGKVVVITGAARGQGLLEAQMLCAQGAKVLICDVLEREGAQAAEAIGSHAAFMRMDVTKEADWHKALDIAAQMGQVHGLVNNAGIYRPADIEGTTVDSFDVHYAVNQRGPFLGMKVFSAHMCQQKHGSIVNIGSAAGMRGSPNSFAYCATKWALRGMTKALAADVGKHNVRVNYIAPGPVNTEMISFRGDEENQRRAEQVPLGRLAEATDVAPMVIYLLSDCSQYITGAEMMIDGGLYL